MKRIYLLAVAGLLLSFLTLIAVPVLAEEASDTTTTVTTNTPPATVTTTRAKKQFDPACLAVAIDNRDTTLINAVDAYGTAVKTALAYQKGCFKKCLGHNSGQRPKSSRQKSLG